MSNDSKNKLVPRLRFPEFKDAGEWEVKRLGEIGELYGGLNGKNAEDFGDGYPFITYRQVFNKSVINFNECDKVRIKDGENQNIVKKGDILFTASSETPDEVGFASVITEEPNTSTYLNSFCFILRPESNFPIIPGFSQYLFHSTTYRKSVIAIAQGITRYNISKSAFREILIPIPSLPEQQKIASCLSSLDELIEAESQKLELYQQHKKGLLQNLFPQTITNYELGITNEEIEKNNYELKITNEELRNNDEEEKFVIRKSQFRNLPKLRFPEFKNAGEWEVKRLGEVYYFLVTNSFSRENLNYERGVIKNIHYGDIHTKFSTLFDITKENVPFVNPDISINKIKEESYCKEGDIVFADASEDLNDVGKSIEIININGEKLLAGLHTLLARQIKKEIVIGFGGYLLKNDWIRKQIQREAQGAKVFGISASRISNIKISYSKNTKEQQKIVSCLTSLDNLINAQREKIELLKQHKKGLLQGLFPELNF